MDIDAVRIRAQIKRFFIISIGACYKSVCKHPLLFGLVCFLIFLYRSFPLLFSLLVSASPILVCTAILLGTLLSFGESNIPEIEKEKEEEEEEEKEKEEVTHRDSSLKTGVLGDATVVVDKDANFFVENFVGKRRDSGEEAAEDESWELNGVGKIEADRKRDDGLGGYVPLLDENSRGIQTKEKVIEVKRGFDDLELQKSREIYKQNQGINEVLSDGEAAECHYTLIADGGNESLLQVEDDKSPGESIEAEHDDNLDSRHLSWKQANDDDREQEEDDEDEDDSGSDGAESSSPDASMADIIPMLDELHPLLDEEASLPAHMARNESDVGSQQYRKIEEGSVESDKDVENQVDGEENDEDDNDNEEEEEEEEETQKSKEDDSKSAIKWTEDDQKNLMDLGTSELERNLRLENLIARRRARKSMRLMAEKNLIDLDGADLPFNVPPISTARRNPFDLPYDAFDDVPGSAPSILLPRHNPFDLPYDSSEEKPDLKGDSFQREFSAFQHKEALFRRHESFNVGSSTFGALKHERPDLRWKPYFVPEGSAAEETSFSKFHRQLSEASESKLSSVPDTESVSSAMDEEDKKFNDEDGSQETEMISGVDHASLLVQRGSLSSEDVDSLDIENVGRTDAHRDGDEITLGDVENYHDLDSSFTASRGATQLEPNTNEILLRMEPGEEDCSSRSSISSLSEVYERISDVKESLSPERSNYQTEESHIATQTSLDADFHFMSQVADENQNRGFVLEPRGNPSIESASLPQTAFVSDFHFITGAEDTNRSMEPVSGPTDVHIGDSVISVQAFTDWDSQISEVVDNVQLKEPSVETRCINISESCITKTSVASVEDDQPKEPVYDRSPQAVEKTHILLSISSDTQQETSEINSTPTFSGFAGEESEVHAENTQKDEGGCIEMHESSLDELSLDDNEPISKEVTESKHDREKVGLTGDDLIFDYQNGFAKQDFRVEHVAVDSSPSSSNNGFIEEGQQDEHDKLHSSSVNGETIFVLHQVVIQNLDSVSSNQVASAEKISHAVEQHSSSAVDASLESNLSSSGYDSLKEHAVSTESILRFEEDRISASVDAEIHVNNCQATGGEIGSVASGTVLMPSGDLNLAVNDELQTAMMVEHVSEASPDQPSSKIEDVKELSFRKEENLLYSSSSDAWSDKAVVEPSLNDHDEFQEPAITPAASSEEVKTENSVHEPEAFDRETFEPASIPRESLEYKSKTGEDECGDYILDKIVYEDSGHFLEDPNHPAEAHGSSTVEENTNEEDEIKEIDDGLLSELDTVGDFRVKQIIGKALGADEVKIQYFNMLSGESSVEVFKLEPPVPEVESVADSDTAFKQIHEGVEEVEVILPGTVEGESIGLGETKSNLPVIEANSLEDVCFATKQNSEGSTEDMSKHPEQKEGLAEVNDIGSAIPTKQEPVLEIRTVNDDDLVSRKLSDSIDVEEMILPDTTEQHIVENGSRDTNLTGFDSEGNNEEISKAPDLNEVPEEVTGACSSISTLELPVLDVKTVHDIDLAFKQLSEGVDVEEVILPSMLEQHVVVNESGVPQQFSSDLHVLEARSLEELHIALKQVAEGNIEEPSKLSDPVKETVSGTIEVNDMGSAKYVVPISREASEVGFIQKSGSGTEESGDQETSTEAPRSFRDGSNEISGT